MLTPVTWIVFVALVLVLFASGLIQVAHRLDRLNLRVATAAETLRASRVERSGAALELATSGALDPAASLLLADAAHRTREALEQPSRDDPGRADAVARAETDLTEAIRAVAEAAAPKDRIDPTDAESADLFADVDRAGMLLAMARRLYNDAAAQCTQLHRARAVRWFRLAGHSLPPATLDFDDAAPPLGPGQELSGR
jgi:hypothetical protein